MKRILAICLALALCVMAPAAFAAEWPEGLGPQKPYSGTPEVDFNETIGYMMLKPRNGESVMPGNVTLKIFLPRADVQTGSGLLFLHSEKGGVVEEVSIEPETMKARPMTEKELEAMLWGCGTAFEVTLQNPLQPNQNYFVQMSEGCISSEEYDVASPAIAGRDSWTFNTNSDNIIEDLIYIREVEGSEQPEKVKDVQPGDKAVFEIVFGEGAVAAALFCDAGSIDALETYFQKVIPVEPAEGEEPEEIAPVMAEIIFPEAGEIKWGVAFLDANGKLVYEITMITNVVVPEAE